MTPAQPGLSSLRFLMDENLQRSVTMWLRDRGHEAIESRDVVGPQAGDQVLAWLASEEGLAIVTHDRDFKAMLTSVSQRRRKRVKRSAMIVWLEIDEAEVVYRLRESIDLIEHNLVLARQRGWQVAMIHIQIHTIRFQYRHPPEGAA